MQKRYHTRGFTLIELMVAIAIIGILATIAMPSYNHYIERGYLSQVHTELINGNNQLKTKLVSSPNLDIKTELKNFPTNYNLDKEVTDRYNFQASLEDESKGRRYRIYAVPKADTGYTKAMWIDSLGNAYKCDNADLAKSFSGSCEAISNKKKSK